MRVRVRLFAGVRGLAGADELWLDLPDGATVAAARAEVARLHPRAAALLARCAAAVGEEFAGDDVVLGENAEVALLPPVSGG